MKSKENFLRKRHFVSKIEFKYSLKISFTLIMMLIDINNWL